MDGGERHQLTASVSSTEKPNDSNVGKQTLIRMMIKRRPFLRPCSPNQHDRLSLLCSITGALISALLWPSHELQLVLGLLASTKTVMKRASDCPDILIDSELMPRTADATSSRVCSCSEVLVSDLHLVNPTDVSRLGSDLESVSVPVQITNWVTVRGGGSSADYPRPHH